jgi:CheY-like chemotaxis protein
MADSIDPEGSPAPRDRLATLAHDLRNALGALSHGVTLLHGGSLPEATRREVCETMARQVQHMRRLLDEGLGEPHVTRAPATSLPLPEASPAPAQGAPAPGAELRVLIVDDHAPSTRALERLLARHCQVRTAASGAEAIAAARGLRPDVVLLDLALPDTTGFDLARRLGDDESTRDAVFVAMTGFGDAATHARIESAGFAAGVVKPVRFEELLGLIQGVRREPGAHRPR